MSTLTKKERKELEDVFLSINNKNKIDFFYLINFFFYHHKDKDKKNNDKNIAKTGVFRDNLEVFFNFFYKLKKNLSK